MFTGAVGDDEIAEQLKQCNRREGLDQVYQVERGGETGACAVIITGHSRYIIFQICILYAEAFPSSDLSLLHCVLLTSSTSRIYCLQKLLPWWRA